MNTAYNLTPDAIVYFTIGPFQITATILFTWVVMAILVLFSIIATTRLKKGPDISRWQALLDSVVSIIRKEVGFILHKESEIYLPFLGSLFLFISVANFLDFIPGYSAPTASLYTTGGLALIVFFAVPFFGIRSRGVLGYLKEYIRPNPFMLPFNILSEFSRTLSMAIRLFGNVMSGSLLVAILLSVTPLFVPVIMQALGLLIGQIQAYIFVILTAVYLGSAVRVHDTTINRNEKGETT